MGAESFADLGWREGLIAIVALLAIYLVVALLRYRKVRQAKGFGAPRVDPGAQAALAAYAATEAPGPAIAGEQEPAAAPAAEAPAPAEAAAPGATEAATFPWNEPPGETPEQQALALLERELEQLRKEVGGLRAEVLLLREEQRREMAKAQVTEKISPIYSDAMQMATQGQDATAISLHCGISRAEAELVVALVRNRDA